MGLAAPAPRTLKFQRVLKCDCDKVQQPLQHLPNACGFEKNLAVVLLARYYILIVYIYSESARAYVGQQMSLKLAALRVYKKRPEVRRREGGGTWFRKTRRLRKSRGMTRRVFSRLRRWRTIVMALYKSRLDWCEYIRMGLEEWVMDGTPDLKRVLN